MIKIKIYRFLFDTKYKRDIRNCISFLKSQLEINNIKYQVSLITKERFCENYTNIYDLIWYYDIILGDFEK